MMPGVPHRPLAELGLVLLEPEDTVKAATRPDTYGCAGETPAVSY